MVILAAGYGVYTYNKHICGDASWWWAVYMEQMTYNSIITMSATCGDDGDMGDGGSYIVIAIMLGMPDAEGHHIMIIRGWVVGSILVLVLL